MNILIVYASTEGQTKKIAEFLKFEAGKLKHNAVICNVDADPQSPATFDAVLIAASVHSEKYQPAIQHYIAKHKLALNLLHSGFISVSLTATTMDKQLWRELKNNTSDLLKDAGWKPRMVEYVAGALLNTQYDYFKKFIVRVIAKKAKANKSKSQDTEYTDWNKLQQFLKNFVDTWSSGPVIVEPDTSDQIAVG